MIAQRGRVVETIRDARRAVHPDEGRVWLGHDGDRTRDMRDFITRISRP